MSTLPSAPQPAAAASPTPSDDASPPAVPRIALLGNPNTGKTTLFNRLCGIRAKTANFPGSTVDARIGRCTRATPPLEIIDLPGVYGLMLDLPESELCRSCLEGREVIGGRPDAVVVVADATNLPRNLLFVAQVLRQRLPTVIALNMIDLARRRGLSIDTAQLSEQLGCPVVGIVARSGEGVDDLIDAMQRPAISAAAVPEAVDSPEASQWADRVIRASVGGEHAVGEADDSLTDRLDAVFTHPVLGVSVFAAVMVGLFFAIFSIAQVPMELIDLIFAKFTAVLDATIPPGAIHDLLVEGVTGGIAGTVVFLPQICLLFFLITLLEDTGYFARAAFVMDRLMCRFGLPGHAFVPLLSAHACAIPAIMSTRLIPDRRDRLATILVAPFMSCSARLPVYVLLIGMLFADRPLLAGIAFAGCYVLGGAAALLTAVLLRRSVLRGASRPMVLELPGYKLPSLRNALFTTFDRAVTFLRKAGTIIVGICIVLWWLKAYPHAAPPPEAAALHAQAEQVATTDPQQADEILREAEAVESRHARASSFIGRLGRLVEPAFRPLGYDWQLSIGVLSSFAAREVFVSTMGVILAGDEATDDPQVLDRLRTARRDDGTPIFNAATSASLLVFYILAMQCLPTLAVTSREAGGWKWALLQFAWMTAMAYGAALLVYQGLRMAGIT